jgi:hypothetical protein
MFGSLVFNLAEAIAGASSVVVVIGFGVVSGFNITDAP